jgi:hypothetical protein
MEPLNPRISPASVVEGLPAVIVEGLSLHPQVLGTAIVRDMFRFAFLLNPRVPHIRRAHVESFVKGGTHECPKVVQHTYSHNEQCRSVSIPPFSKGGVGGI